MTVQTSTKRTQPVLETRNESHGPDNRTTTEGFFGLRPLLAATQLVSCNQSVGVLFWALSCVQRSDSSS